MKRPKWIFMIISTILLLVAFVLVSKPPAEGATVGCPVNFPQEGGFIAGLEVNEFSNYRFSELDTFGADFFDCASSQYVAKFQWGVNNWVAVTGKVGSADFRLTNPATQEKWSFSRGSIYGGGAKLVLYEIHERAMRVVMSSEYLLAEPGGMVNGGEHSVKWKEWDNSLLLAFSRQEVAWDDMFTGTTFYLGAKHTQPEITWRRQESKDAIRKDTILKSDDNIMFFAGFDVVLDSHAIISAEARIGNIDSYTLAFGYRF